MARKSAGWYKSHPNNRYWIKRGLKAWREKVLARSHGQCVICGKLATNAHHLLGRRAYPQYILTPANGVGLCVRHHVYGAPGEPCAHAAPRAFDDWLRNNLPHTWEWVQQARKCEGKRPLTRMEECLILEGKGEA